MNHVFTLLVIGFLGCSSNHEARTPREFIEKYSDAWQREDVDTILNMRVRKKYPDLEIKPDLRKTIEEYWLGHEKEEIEQSIKRRDFSYTAWTKTTYVSEREHDDHIHVDVQIEGARSAVVLVRDGGLLKIHPNPSLFR